MIITVSHVVLLLNIFGIKPAHGQYLKDDQPQIIALRYQQLIKYQSSLKRTLNYGGYMLDLTTGDGDVIPCVLDSRTPLLMMQDSRYCLRALNLSFHLYQTCLQERPHLCLDKICESRCSYVDYYQCRPSINGSCDFKANNISITVGAGGAIEDDAAFVSSTGLSFQWDDMDRLDSNTTQQLAKCRLGLFSAQADDVKTNLLEKWAVSSGIPVVTLDLGSTGAESSLVVGGYETALNTQTKVISNRRLMLEECRANFYTFIYALELCGNDVMADYGAIVARISLADQYLTVPKAIYDRIIQYLPVDCEVTDENRFCSVNTDLPLTTTTISFALETDGRKLHIPFSKLITEFEGDNYLRIAYRSTSGNSDAEVPEITIGAELLASLFVSINYGTDRLELSNKLAEVSGNVLCTTTTAPYSLYQINNKSPRYCTSRGLRTFTSENDACEPTTGAKFILSLLMILYAMNELSFHGRYAQVRRKILQRQLTRSG